MKDAPKLKAFLGQDEDGGEIVFAASLAAAEALTDHGPVHRASQYDQWAGQGFVPPKALIEEFGCRFGCHNHSCNNTIEHEGEGCDEEGDYFDIKPLYVGMAVYCCAACNDRANAEVVRHIEIAGELRAGLLQGWPGVTPGECATYNTPPFIFFRFPGAKCDATWALGADHIKITALDSDAYQAYKESLTSSPTSTTL